jgi:hypothetical protein
MSCKSAEYYMERTRHTRNGLSAKAGRRGISGQQAMFVTGYNRVKVACDVREGAGCKDIQAISALRETCVVLITIDLTNRDQTWNNKPGRNPLQDNQDLPHCLRQ